MDQEENLPEQEESPKVTEGAVPERDSQGQRVILKSLGALLIESSLAGDSPTPYPSYCALMDNSEQFWLENQDKLLYNPN
jgi:hypothetical protein